MTGDTILAEVGDVIRDVLDNDQLLINAATSARDVPEWDSLAHVQLVVAVEKHFGIRFTSTEIRSFDNVGEMCDCIRRKPRRA